MRYDIIVVGCGPAGLSAAMTARARNKNVVVVGNRWEDSPLAKAKRIENYPGLPGISGAELLQRLYDQAKDLGVEFIVGKVNSAMAFHGAQVSVGERVLRTRALIMALGVVHHKRFEGEAQFLGRGVSYCATCDGMLYRTHRVVVIGLTEEAVQDALFLRSIDCHVTYMAHERPKDLPMEIRCVRTDDIVIEGDRTVSEVHAYDWFTREYVTVYCEGVFILRHNIAPKDVMPGLDIEGGVIKVDHKTMETNLPGVYAAGDCTGGPLQLAKAVGQGQIAALSACSFQGY